MGGAWIAAVVILILIGLVYTAATALITSLPVLGWIANLFIGGVVYGIFRARYLAVAYESVPARGG
ncbi:hypothetical protein [Methanoculleus chikugoensis]|uniref:hypothetical protein n=1 Tax=Methanoculleus chikugoensis TaxID=118126 RepID=UPI001FB537CA|nr:hypothetical protein [Methanoculleus chikugoensis]